MADSFWWDKIQDNPFLLIQPNDHGERFIQQSMLVQQASEIQRQVAMQYQAQLKRTAWERGEIDYWQLYGIKREPTQEEKDLMEATREVDALLKEVRDRYELYDWVAQNEVDAIAPGWTLTPDENRGKE